VIQTFNRRNNATDLCVSHTHTCVCVTCEHVYLLCYVTCLCVRVCNIMTQLVRHTHMCVYRHRQHTHTYTPDGVCNGAAHMSLTHISLTHTQTHTQTRHTHRHIHTHTETHITSHKIMYTLTRRYVQWSHIHLTDTDTHTHTYTHIYAPDGVCNGAANISRETATGRAHVCVA